jgi:predicted nucleotidyltransferase
MNGISKEREKEILEYIKDMILNSSAFNDIKVIGVTGSIGRGEKSILDENLNDIDFFVISKSENLNEKLTLEKELQKLTNTLFTDIAYINTSKFKIMTEKKIISQFLYDLLKGCCTIYLDEKFSKTFNNARKKEYGISSRSAVQVLLTRLWCLTGPYEIKEGKIAPINAIFTSYQMRKAFSAIIDAVLIHENVYKSPCSSYKLRKFSETNFYTEHEIKLNELLEFYKNKDKNFDFERTYNNLVDLYLLSIDYVIGADFSHYLKFPLKKELFLSFIIKKHRNYVISMTNRYKTLKLVGEYYKNSSNNEKIIKDLKINFRKIYAEVIK